MLRKIKNKNEFDKYIEYAYNLAMNSSNASYPIYYDKIKTKEDFINSESRYNDDSEVLLLFFYENNIKGWIHYYYFEEDLYIQNTQFLIEDYFSLAMNEFLEYISKDFRGYSLHLGFPDENIMAKDFFANYPSNLYEIEEKAYNNCYEINRLVTGFENHNVEIISKDRFNDFKEIHEIYESDMYWSSDKIVEDFENWTILVYKKDDIVLGAIYILKCEMLYEIFGIDILNSEIDSKSILKSLLCNSINHLFNYGAKKLCYFSSYDELELLHELGFYTIGLYTGYKLYI
jgi:hypothetical protein